MRTRGALTAAAVAAALLSGGCTVTTTFKVDAGAATDAPVTCARGVPLVQLPSLGSTCVGDFAAQTFRFALCSCANLDVGGGLRTDSYDDTMGPYTPANSTPTGAPVGIDGSVHLGGAADVQGTLIIAGAGASAIGDTGTVHADLALGGDLTVGKTLFVVRSAWAEGNISAPDGVMVAGNFIQPPGAKTPPGLAVGGMQMTDTFNVQPPCSCAAGPQDIMAAVGEASATNNDDVASVPPEYLKDPPANTQVSLPCGRFYVDEVSGSAPATLLAEGHVVLFVGHDFTAWDALTIRFSPGAELDVFVAGNLSLGTATSWGTPMNAGALRFYVAGTVSMGSATTFAGNLYAPGTTVDTQTTEIFGSLLAGGVKSASDVAVHFDRSVLGAGADCSVDKVPQSCATCSDCNGTDGCVGGRCGGCEQDRDCCDPLVCIANRCEALVF